MTTFSKNAIRRPWAVTFVVMMVTSACSSLLPSSCGCGRRKTVEPVRACDLAEQVMREHKDGAREYYVRLACHGMAADGLALQWVWHERELPSRFTEGKAAHVYALVEFPLGINPSSVVSRDAIDEAIVAGVQEIGFMVLRIPAF